MRITTLLLVFSATVSSVLIIAFVPLSLAYPLMILPILLLGYCLFDAFTH